MSLDGDSHQCPDCYKYASKYFDEACPDCGEELKEVQAYQDDSGEWVVVDD